MTRPLSGESQRYRVFWGETHHNTYQHHVQDPPLGDVLAFASKHLDFYTGAYYTPVFTPIPPLASVAGRVEAPAGGHVSEADPAAGARWKGVRVEALKDAESLRREWAEFQAVTADWNRPGEFVAFPGYEWQGNARWGDHNVVYKTEGLPIFGADTLAELYECLRGRGALAIPHHTGYQPGMRAPVWSACDDSISPYAEVFSIHGCSETDEEWIGLRNNAHMGPGTGGGTYQDALDAGLHLGAICSTDNWTNMPGHWGQGLMACLAEELTRESLWAAFCARRVYGVTGDRILLDFTLNARCMGSVLPFAPARHIRVAVRGSDAIDRIEILRNGRVLATHCHQGTWDLPAGGRPGRFKLRVEPGWGPHLGEIPMPDQHWQGELTVTGGRMIGWEPAWVTRDQGVPELAGGVARFTMVSRQHYATRPCQGATIFEFEADPDAALTLRLNGIELAEPVRAFAARSRVLWYRDECIERVGAATGLEPEDAGRGDTYFHNACKAKLHRVIPEAGYTATFEITDDEPLTGETHYRIRVEQRNGQRAWSSPIWVGGS
jgi:hypothetical protein